MKQSTLILRGLMLSLILMAGITMMAQDNTYPGVHINPAPGTVKHLSEFEMTFDGMWGLGTYRRSPIKVTGPEGVEIPKVYNYSTGSSYIIYFEDEQVITAPGEYTLTIPEGKFAISDVDLGEMSFKYTIENDDVPADIPSYTMTPEPGTYDVIEQGFRMTFDTDEEVYVRSNEVKLTGPEGRITISATVYGNGKTIAVEPVNAVYDVLPINRPGEYELTFDAKSITVGRAQNPEPIVFKYTIAGEAIKPWTGTFSATPADGSVLDRLHEVSIVFDMATTVELSERATPEHFPAIYDDATNTRVTGCTAFANGNELQLTLSSTITDPGSYTLVIPTHFLTIDNANPAEDIKVKYTIEGQAQSFGYTYKMTPEEGSIIGDTQSITIAFEGDELASVTNDIYAWGNTAPHFTNEMGAYNPNLQLVLGNNSFTFTHQWPFETNGEYTLVIPANYFTFTSTNGETVKNTTINVKYIVGTSGIESVTISDDAVDVYNVSGINMLNNADSQAVKNLPAGIYIINGQKTIIK